MSITSLPPLSLYIHVPWCVRKCPYCDFNSHSVKTEIPETLYVERLLEDLAEEMPSVWGRSLNSIFIGGGTPSLFQPQSYERLFSGIRALIPFHADIEITMEANPGTAEAEKFAGFIEAGINRISIGVQSFNDEHLKSLGRIHSSAEAIKAYEIARQAGCRNINLDLMYALPGQTREQALKDLKIAQDLAPEHLSWYQLTLEPNTLFYHQPPQLPADEVMDEIAEAGLEFLQANDYQRYEISAYAKSGQRPSQHNLNYWQFGDYLGIGAGAHGKITRADNQSIYRTSKKRNPKDYLDRTQPLLDNKKSIPKDELPLEFMMNAMRLKSGVATDTFFARTGLVFSYLAPVLESAKSDDLIEEVDGSIRATEKGYLFLNELLEYFMPDNFTALKEDLRIPTRSLE